MRAQREHEDQERFAQQCRRALARPVTARIRYGFFRNPNPMRDAAPDGRSFASMAEYRRWMAEHSPRYFGYQPADSA